MAGSCAAASCQCVRALPLFLCHYYMRAHAQRAASRAARLPAHLQQQAPHQLSCRPDAAWPPQVLGTAAGYAAEPQWHRLPQMSYAEFYQVG